MRDGEPQIYTALATMRNGYMQSQWQRVQMFIVFNTIAIPLVFGSTADSTLKLIASGAGALVHTVLLQGVLRADNWVHKIDAKLREFEELDHGEDTGTRVRFFSELDFSNTRRSWFASRYLFALIGVTATLVWILQTIGRLHGII